MRAMWTLLLVLTAAGLLAGCGNKGELVRPEPEQSVASSA